MSTAHLAESLSSIVTIMPRKRTARLKYINVIPNARDDRAALRGDFVAVGNDMRIAIKKYGEAAKETS